MRTITIRSFAKLNLTFEILENLPGGYHSIRTLFQSIDLADTLSFTLVDVAPDAEFNVEILEERVKSSKEVTDVKTTFPLNDENLIVKAAKRFEQMSRCGAGRKLVVSVNKQIPIAAGMAGGSGNAAAAIRAMQEFFPEHCSQDSGDHVASALGSDINFCLHGGTQIGTNRGEVLNPVTNTKQLSFLIVKPRDIAISTPWIFRQYDDSVAGSESNHADANDATSNDAEPNDAKSNDAKPNDIKINDALNEAKVNYTAACCNALTEDSLQKLGEAFFNSFERICFEHYPRVQILRDVMLEAGCLSAHITGSGPTLFGLLPSGNMGTQVRDRFVELTKQLSGRTDFDCWLSASTATGLVVTFAE
jgi:4-diphosphocytidyl-2-C-methyl-D-erythritol kinase